VPETDGLNRTFSQPFLARWIFLMLSLGNVGLVALVLGRPLAWEGIDWLIYLLCLNIILLPLFVQLIRLDRHMTVSVTERYIRGRTFFGRVVEMDWEEVREVVRMQLPMREATLAVVSEGGAAGRRITFAETIEERDSLLRIIMDRAPNCRKAGNRKGGDKPGKS
jgi:hypothetical protein